MEKKDFTKRYAQQTHSTAAEAADQIDRVVDDLLRRLRAGQPASLPGLGRLNPPAPPSSAGRPSQSKAKSETKSNRKAGAR